jgi:hypothetical protein
MLEHAAFNHRVVVDEGLMAAPSAALLQ